MTAHINIVHKLYDRQGDLSGYMVKNGHGTPDEYRVYDAEGTFLYGLVVRQPWTVFRIYGQDGSLTYVGLTRSKNLEKRLGQLDLSGTVAKEDYSTRQQAENAEKRYVRQMGFPKYGLSTPGRRKFGPHEGTRKYIRSPQAPGKRQGAAYLPHHPSRVYVNSTRIASTGKYVRREVSPGKYVNAVRGEVGPPHINDQRALFDGYYRTRDTLTWMFKASEQRRLEQLEDERKEKPKHQRKNVVKALRPYRWKKGHLRERCVYCSEKRPWRSKWPGAAQLRLFDDEPYRSCICSRVLRRPLPSRKGIESRKPGKVGGFRWGRRMGLRDGYSLKAPDAVHLPTKLVDPRVRAEAIAAAEAIHSGKDERKEVSSPTLVSSVFRNVATHYIGSWGALKRDEARQVSPSGGKYDGLNEILAEVDGERYDVDIVTDPRLLRRLEEDPAFKALWVEYWANKAVDATVEDLPALPWVEAYRYVGERLGRKKLSREDRLAVGLQLSKLLKRLRQRGSLKWTATDALPDDEVPKRSVVDQERAAELCGVSPRTIKSLEDIYEDPKPYTARTLRKIYDGLRRIAEDGVEPWQDTGLPPMPAPKETPVTGRRVADMTPQEYAEMLAGIATDGLGSLSKPQEWIVAVKRGREIITLNLNTLYRERYNFAAKEVKVKRDGILMGLARKRYGSWDDLAQAAFLGLWKGAGYKHPDDTDKRRKDVPVEPSIFTLAEDGTLKPVFPADEDPVFEEWAWKRGDSPARSERRRDTTHRQRERTVGEEWKLALLQASRETTRGWADHNTAYLGGKKLNWNARHVVLLDIAKSRACGIPVALKWGAAAKVLRVLLVILEHADPRRKLSTRVKDWPFAGYASPERLSRMGETRRLYPIRRRLLPAHRGDGPPEKPDDFQVLGPYPFGNRTLLDNVVYPVAGFFFDHGKLTFHGVQKPIEVENEVWPGDPLKDLEKLYKTKRLKEEQGGPKRVAEFDHLKGVETISLGEAAENVWDPQGKGVGVDTYDPEDDRGDLSREKVEE